MSTTLLESNLGVMVGPGILCPTIKAFFFSPLIARRILSPTLPTPVLLYTWIHFGGRWYGVFPKALLSTTRTRVSFCIAWRAPVILKCRWITVLLRWVKDKPNRLFKRAMWILVILPAVAVGGAEAAFVCAGCRGAACSPPCLSSRHRCGGEQQGGRSDVSRVGAAGWYRPASRTLEDLAKGCQIRLVSIAVEPGSPFLLFVLIAIPSKSVNRGFCSCPRMRPVRSYLLEASCQKSMMRLQSAQCSEQV